MMEPGRSGYTRILNLLKVRIKKIYVLFLLIGLYLLLFSGIINKQHATSTYCNPVNIDYTYSIVNTSKGLSYRSGADPAVVEFRGEFYMFVTRSFGYWHSKNLESWNFIRPQSWYFESSNAPAAWSYKDSILIALGNPSEWQCVIYTDNPKKGTWKGVPSLIPADVHDPALFVDDDNKVYLYTGSSNVYPLKGVELDPENYFLPVGDFHDLVLLHPEQHGWERFGENHMDTTAGYLEGAWMTKHDNRYYLQYAAPGTEWNVYGDGVYISDNPLGPFTYAEYSPFSYKPGGFIRGAGHGSTVRDVHGNYWHFATMVVGVNYYFERRIGMFPAGFDEEGQLYTNTAYGDYPHYLPASKQTHQNDLFTGWMLLSYKKKVTASSFIEHFPPSNVTDEKIKSVWVSKSNSDDQWIIIDLQNPADVKAVQVNYSDYKSDIFGKRDSIYHQYVIEYSADGTDWSILIDKSKNFRDVPNDYTELPEAQRARYIRFRNIHHPTPYLAISDLRIFGRGTDTKPSIPDNFKVDRQGDRRTAQLKWSQVNDAQGYMIYFGIAPEKLFNSVMVYDETHYTLNSLNVAPAYYFSVESFNENGISGRTGVVECK